MDAISDILSKVRLSSAVYFRSDFHGSWGMDNADSAFAQFHIVTAGKCILKIDNQKVPLTDGDIVVFPFGTRHWLASHENSVRASGKHVVDAILSGKSVFEEGSPSTTLVCGHFEFDRNLDHQFIQELPSLIHISKQDQVQYMWLREIIELVIAEAAMERPGSRVIVNKLGEILFIHVLRVFIEENKSSIGFAAAMQDHRISRALNQIHSFPENDWQLGQLARVAGMSRTSFAIKFKTLIGETPFSYLTRWRLIQARELLRDGTLSVGQVAIKVGYQSESAFNRIFKKRTLITPFKYRQTVTGL